MFEEIYKKIKEKFSDAEVPNICIPCLIKNLEKELSEHALNKKIEEFYSKVRRKVGAWRVFPGQQHYNNCGVQSSNQLIAAEKRKSFFAEDDILTKSLENGRAYRSGGTKEIGSLGRSLDPGDGGTSPLDRQAILAANGVASTIVPTTKESLAKAIRENKGIIANVDGDTWFKQNGGGGHAIVVYDGNFDHAGNLTEVFVNDTGDGKRKKIPIDEFMDAVNARQPPLTPGELNVTTKPMW